MKREKTNIGQTTPSIQPGLELTQRDGAFKITTQANYKNEDWFYETPVGESLTEQDQTLPIPEIMRRAMQGIKPQIGSPVYSETDDFDEIDILKSAQADMVDRAETKQALQSRIEELEVEASSVPSAIDNTAKGMEPAE